MKRTIHEILILVKKELLKNRGQTNPKTTSYDGLCTLTSEMSNSSCYNTHYTITHSEYILFINHLNNHTSHEGFVINEYVWTPYLIRPRLQWLTRQINLTKKTKLK